MEETKTGLNPEFEKLLEDFDKIANDYEKLSIVAREANVAVALMDYNGNFKWINSGYTKLYGYTFEQLINEKGKSIFGRHTDPAVKMAFGKCIIFKQTQLYEYYNTKRDDTKIWLQSILTPVIDPETNKVIQLIAIDTDITEIKTIQEEIKQQKEEIQAQAEVLEKTNRELEKLSIVAEKTDNAVIIADSNGNIEWVNKAFTKLFGFTLEEFLTETGNSIFSTSTNPVIKETIELCFTEKHSVTYESGFKTKKGNLVWLQTTLTPTFDENQTISKLIAVYSDITQQKEAEIKIQQQAEELKSANESLRERQEEIIQQAEELRTINNELEEQKLQLQFKNEAINSSLTYALTIQRAILPPKELIDKEFENFILYKPKDIVSGDFYWYCDILSENGDIQFIAVVDCTGHGVPGAFMSMIGSRLLNEIVIEKGILNPVYILDFLNMGVKMALRQETSSNEDGMDICLCKIENGNDQTYKIIYSGAKIPLLVYKKQNRQLYTFKASRKGIGGTYYDHLTFNSEEIFLNTGDAIYLASDGFADQNNSTRKRIGTNMLYDILKYNAEKTMNEQLIVLETEFENFRQNEPQRDDITIIGLKLL